MKTIFISSFRRLLAVCFSFLFVGSLHGLVVQADTDICQLARHPDRYANRVLRVRGYYMSGPHGAVIYNSDCGFRNRWAIFGRTAAGDLTYDDLSVPPPEDSPGPVNQQSIKQLIAEAGEAIQASGMGPPLIPITIVALVRVAPDYSIKSIGNRSEPDYAGTGFGFMGRYQLQLRVLRVEKFSIISKKPNSH